MLAKEERYNCYYICYFASYSKIRSKSVVKQLSKKVMELVPIRKTDNNIFASIEKGNRGSYKVVESAGYHSIAIIKTIGFSSFLT